MPTAPAGPLTQPAGTFGNLDRWNLRLARSKYIFAIDFQSHDSLFTENQNISLWSYRSKFAKIAKYNQLGQLEHIYVAIHLYNHGSQSNLWHCITFSMT